MEHKVKGKGEGAVAYLTLFSLLFCLTFFFRVLYSIPLRDSVFFYIGIFLYFFIPGSLLLRYLDFNNDEYFLKIFHSTAIGTAFMPLLYLTLRKLSHPEIIIPIGVGVFLLWFILTIKDLKIGQDKVHTTYPYQNITSVVVLIAVIVLLLHLSYFSDIIFLKKGFKIRNTFLNETVFHLGIINVLRELYPPFFPYASGYDFSYYHLNMHLEIEMFHRIFSIDTLKLTFFYFPLLYFSLLVFVPYIFIRQYESSRFIAILGVILIFGSDLSFIPGMFGLSPEGQPWTVVFSTPIWSLFTINGYLPSLFIMFLFLLYVKKYYDTGRLLYLIILALLGYSAYGFKSSMGPHLAGAAFLTGVASVFFKEDSRAGLRLCIVSGLTALTILLDIIVLKAKSIDIIGFDLLNGLYRSCTILGIPEIPWFFYLIIFPLYIFATFGVRVIGFSLFKDVLKKKTFDPSLFFILAFTISGFLIGEMIYIGPPQHEVNKAYFFSEQSLICAWLLLPYLFLKHGQKIKKLFSFLIAAILLSAPSTVQFFSLRSAHSYHTVDSNALEVVRYLQTTPVDSVVLHPPIHYPNEIGPSLASNFAGRASVINLFRSFSEDWIGGKEFMNRTKDIVLFFNYTINRSPILKKYNVDYVYAPVIYMSILDREALLKQVLKNEEYVLYEVKKDHDVR